MRPKDILHKIKQCNENNSTTIKHIYRFLYKIKQRDENNSITIKRIYNVRSKYIVTKQIE